VNKAIKKRLEIVSNALNHIKENDLKINQVIASTIYEAYLLGRREQSARIESDTNKIVCDVLDKALFESKILKVFK